MHDEPACMEWAEKLATRNEELSPVDRQALEEHLLHCPVCAAVALDYAFLSARLRSLPPPIMKPFPRLARRAGERSRVQKEVTLSATQPVRLLPAPTHLYLKPAAAVTATTPTRWIAAARTGVAMTLLLLASLSLLLFHHDHPVTGLPPAHRLGLSYTSVALNEWSPDDLQIVTPGIRQTIQVWSAITGRHVFTLPGSFGHVSSVAWSPDGTRLAIAGTSDPTVQVWNVLTGKHLLTYYGHSSSVLAVAWSPDGEWIASAGDDQTVQVWNAATGVQSTIYRGHKAAVFALAWSPDGKRIASTGEDQTVQVWNARTGAPLFTYYGHSGPVLTLAWSPNGAYVASAGDDQTVQIWNAATGVALLIYHGHRGPVSTVAWSPDGEQIASAGDDQTVQVWYAFTGERLLTYRGHTAPVSTVAWSPNGTYIASEAADQTVQVWNVFTGEISELFMFSNRAS